MLFKYKQFFTKHSFLSLFIKNFHKIDNNFYRSAQLSNEQLEKVLKKYNIKTVLNLRGYENKKLIESQKKICEKYNTKLIIIKLNSRSVPKKEQINNLYNILTTEEYPMLVHCKSGSDRTGLVATLYRHWIKNEDLSKIDELKFFPYLHVRYSKTGLIDFYFEKYLEFKQKNPNISLLDWTNYFMDRKSIEKEFKEKKFFSIIVDKILKRE